MDKAALRWGTIEDPPFEASKWLKSQVLLDDTEMAQLFADLNPVLLYLCGSINPRGSGPLLQAEFLQNYRLYVGCLKTGHALDLYPYRKWLSPIMTVSTEALYAIPIGEHQQLIRIGKPVVQMQAHHIGYSTVDKKFRSQVFGSDSIAWGIQLSYPQLYQNPYTKQIETLRDNPTYPNTALFQQIQKWMRQYTIPTAFMAEGIRQNVPMRLGKKCLSWINRHPHLVAKGIHVHG